MLQPAADLPQVNHLGKGLLWVCQSVLRRVSICFVCRDKKAVEHLAVKWAVHSRRRPCRRRRTQAATARSAARRCARLRRRRSRRAASRRRQPCGKLFRSLAAEIRGHSVRLHSLDMVGKVYRGRRTRSTLFCIKFVYIHSIGTSKCRIGTP